MHAWHHDTGSEMPRDRAGSVTKEIPIRNDNAEAIGLTKGVLKLRDRTLRGRSMNTIRPVGGH